MNKILEPLMEEKLDDNYLFIINVFEKILLKDKYISNDSYKIIEKSIEEQYKSKNEKFESITSSNEEETSMFYNFNKNPKVIIEKIINSYTHYLKNKTNSNVIDLFNNIPETYGIVYKIDKKNILLFQPFSSSFINFFLTQFMKKITDLKEENKEKKFFDRIPYLFFKQNIANNNSNKVFIDWIEKSIYFKKFEKIFNISDDFSMDLMENFSSSFIYETDYLKSPFDEKKVSQIYERTLENLTKLNKNSSLFLTKNEKGKELIKLIIQENMLDFISDNVFIEGFIKNKDFYAKNLNKIISVYEKKMVSKSLFEQINTYIYDIAKSGTEFNAITEEYYQDIKFSIAKSMIEFYKEQFLQYQISYYKTMDNMNKNKIIEMYSQNINHNLKFIEDKEAVKELRKKMSKMNSNSGLSDIIEIYKEMYKNFSNTSKVFSFNEEDMFLIKYSEYFKENEKILDNNKNLNTNKNVNSDKNKIFINYENTLEP